MNYEVVTLEQKTIVGLGARTSNSSPDMSAIIGGLWKRLFEEKLFFTLPNKVNSYSIGLYSDYSTDETGEYDITVGCEVSSVNNLSDNTIVKTIPAGKYAKFVVFGDMVKAVSKAWGEIWSMPLDRSYTGDFEEYISAEEQGDCEVHIYVALK